MRGGGAFRSGGGDERGVRFRAQTGVLREDAFGHRLPAEAPRGPPEPAEPRRQDAVGHRPAERRRRERAPPGGEVARHQRTPRCGSPGCRPSGVRRREGHQAMGQRLQPARGQVRLNSFSWKIKFRRQNNLLSSGLRVWFPPRWDHFRGVLYAYVSSFFLA